MAARSSSRSKLQRCLRPSSRTLVGLLFAHVSLSLSSPSSPSFFLSAYLRATTPTLSENNIGKLRELRELCNCKDAEVASSVSKLAMVSLTMVFKDIIPGYRIRPLSEKEKSTTVSKEVKQVRNFEQGLLANYQAFLQHLYKRIKGRSDR